MKNQIPSSFFLKHQEKLVVCLFLSSFFAFSLLSRARYGIFLFALGGLIYFWNYFLNKNLKSLLSEFLEIRMWVGCVLGLWIMACFSLLYCFDIHQTFLMILKFLIFPTVVAFVLYLVFKNLDSKLKNFSAFAMFCLFILHSLATIWVYLKTGSSRSVGIGDHSIIPYATYLIIAFAFSLSFLIFSRFKIISFVCLCVSLFALYVNGTRASIVAVYGIVCLGFLYPSYRSKKLIVCLGMLVLLGGGFVLYQWSGKQEERFNFRSMDEKIEIVWSYAPAEMGRFDEGCFSSYSLYRCSSYSGMERDNRFSFEGSALIRISLNKSALLILQQNKLIPMGYFPRFFNENLFGFQEKDLPYKYFKYEDKVFLDHIHNAILSAFLEMGILGGLFYLSFFLVLMYLGWKNRGLYGGALLFGAFGVFVMSFFDSMLSFFDINLLFYMFCGITLGLIGGKNENFI